MLDRWGTQAAEKASFGAVVRTVRGVLQEVHGDAALVAQCFPEIAAHFHIFSNSGDEFSSGGVTSLVAKAFCPQRSAISHSCLVPGRVSRLVISDGAKQCAVWNIHNFGISQLGMQAVSDRWELDAKEADEHPLRFFLVAAGDFNCQHDGVDALALGKSENGFLRTKHTSGQHSSGWSKLMGYITEITNFSPTHLFAPTNKLTVIDRMGFGGPGWYLLRFRRNLSVISDPILLRSARISDHAPILATLEKPPFMCPRSRPIPPYVCKHPLFHSLACRWAAACCIEQKSTVVRWETHKNILREVGTIVRDALMVDQTCSKGRLCVLNSIARGLATGDQRMLERLWRLSPTAREHIQLVEGTWQLDDGPGFNEEIRTLRSDDLADRIDEKEGAGGNTNGKKKLNRGNGLRLLASLWKPHLKRLSLQAGWCMV